jgi:hypothetical protein
VPAAAHALESSVVVGILVAVVSAVGVVAIVARKARFSLVYLFTACGAYSHTKHQSSNVLILLANN